MSLLDRLRPGGPRPPVRPPVWPEPTPMTGPAWTTPEPEPIPELLPLRGHAYGSPEWTAAVERACEVRDAAVVRLGTGLWLAGNPVWRALQEAEHVLRTDWLARAKHEEEARQRVAARRKAADRRAVIRDRRDARHTYRLVRIHRRSPRP